MGKGYAIASMILGICSILFCLGGFLPLGAGILAIILTTVSFKKETSKKEGHGMAVAGLVTGIIGVIFSAFYSLLWTILFSAL